MYEVGWENWNPCLSSKLGWKCICVGFHLKKSYQISKSDLQHSHSVPYLCFRSWIITLWIKNSTPEYFTHQMSFNGHLRLNAKQFCFLNFLATMNPVAFGMYVGCSTQAGVWEAPVLVDQTCTLLPVPLVGFRLLRVRILQAIEKPWIL